MPSGNRVVSSGSPWSALSRAARLALVASFSAAPLFAFACSAAEEGAEPLGEQQLAATFPPGWSATTIVDFSGATGSATYDGAGTYHLTSKSYGMRPGGALAAAQPGDWPDGAEFVSKSVTGNIEIVVRVVDATVTSQGGGVVMAGVSIRESLDPLAVRGAGWFHPGFAPVCTDTPLKEIATFGGSTRVPLANVSAANRRLVAIGDTNGRTKTSVWLRLQRVAGNYAVARSTDGNTWVPIGGGPFIPNSAVIGFFVGGAWTGAPDTAATFDNVYVGPVRSAYSTSWLGSSFVQDSTDYVAREMESFYVTPAGTSFKAAVSILEGGHDVTAITPAGLPLRLPAENTYNIPGPFRGAIAGDQNDLYLSRIGASGNFIEHRTMPNFAPAGELSMVLGPLGQVAGLAAAPGILAVSDRTNNFVRIVNTSTGVEVNRFFFQRPGAIAIHRAARLWIVHSATAYPDVNDLVARFDNFFATNPKYTLDDTLPRPANCSPFLPPALGLDCPIPLYNQSGDDPPGRIECRTLAGAPCVSSTTQLAIPLINVAGSTNPTNPTALAISLNTDPAQDQLIVADNGPDQQLHFCTNLGTAPNCSATFGVKGGALAGPVPGSVNPRTGNFVPRFFGLAGVGVDGFGNLYVASSAPRVEIRKFSPPPARTPLWSYLGLGPEPGAFDPASDGSDFYTLTRHLGFNPTSALGTHWDSKSVTINPFASYPDSERFLGTIHAQPTPLIRRPVVGGAPIMYVRGPEEHRLRMYRFQGEIAVPSGSVSQQNGKIVLWVDLDSDGMPEENEVKRAEGLLNFSADVDARGNIWLMDPAHVWEVRFKGFNGFGVPTYDDISLNAHLPSASPVTDPGDRFFLRFDKDNDVLYVLSTVPLPDYAAVGCFGPGGRRQIISRFEHWHSPTAHTAAYTVSLPDPRLTRTQTDDYTARWTDPLCSCSPDFGANSFDVAGDLMFAGLRDGQILVYDARTGAAVTRLWPGPEVSAAQSWSDTVGAMQAFRRSTGEYLITNTDVSSKSHVTLYRFTPTQSSAVLGTSCTQDANCTVNAGASCGSLTGRATCPSALSGLPRKLDRCVATQQPPCTVTVPDCGSVPGHRTCAGGNLFGECVPNGLHQADGLEVVDLCDGVNNDCDAQTDEDNPAPTLDLTPLAPQCPNPAGNIVTLSGSASDSSGFQSLNWTANGQPAGSGLPLTTTIPYQSLSVYSASYQLTAIDDCSAHRVAAVATNVVTLAQSACVP